MDAYLDVDLGARGWALNRAWATGGYGLQAFSWSGY